MEDYIVKEGKKLRFGYTTGSCAAAAAKAAAYMLLTGREKNKIKISTPKGMDLELEVLNIDMSEDYVSCGIVKDAGDDPDITSGAIIFAKVSKSEKKEIYIDGGAGVGRVTKRGLDQPVGEAAINSVPRQMITENIKEVCKLADYNKGLKVEISVPEGEKLAQKTFNSRLGILGGISILGTTGIVEPMSEQALVDTIRVELRQRKENGDRFVLLTPGNYGSDFIKYGMELDSKLAVLTSNFIGDSLDICVEMGFEGILLVGHIGKLVKIAGGMLNTHSKYGDCRMDIMAAHAGALGLASEHIGEILDCATCDDALRILKENCLYEETLKSLSSKIEFIMNHRVRGNMKTGAILFSKEYGFLAGTSQADELLELLTEQKKEREN